MFKFIITSILTIFIETREKNKLFNAKRGLFHTTVIVFFFCLYIFIKIYIIHSSHDTLGLGFFFYKTKQLKNVFITKLCLSVYN